MMKCIASFFIILQQISCHSCRWTLLFSIQNACMLYLVFSLGWLGDQWGRAIVGGGCLFGIGSLCFYGLALSNETGAIDRAM